MNILYNPLSNQEVLKTILGWQEYMVPSLIGRSGINQSGSTMIIVKKT